MQYGLTLACTRTRDYTLLHEGSEDFHWKAKLCAIKVRIGFGYKTIVEQYHCEAKELSFHYRTLYMVHSS